MKGGFGWFVDDFSEFYVVSFFIFGKVFFKIKKYLLFLSVWIVDCLVLNVKWDVVYLYVGLMGYVGSKFWCVVFVNYDGMDGVGMV